MTQYRRKPQLIEAFQWTGGIDQNEDPVWAVEAIRDGRIRIEQVGKATRLIVSSKSGIFLEDAYPGCYIIRHACGQIAAEGPDDFLALYEPA